MPKVRLKPNPTLVDLIQIWLSKSGFRLRWFIDRHFYGNAPGVLAYLSSEHNDLPIHKDFVALGESILPESQAGQDLGEAGLKLLAGDPKFFSKLASVLGLIQSQRVRLSAVEKWFYAEDVKKIKRVINS